MLGILHTIKEMQYQLKIYTDDKLIPGLTDLTFLFPSSLFSNHPSFHPKMLHALVHLRLCLSHAKTRSELQSRTNMPRHSLFQTTGLIHETWVNEQSVCFGIHDKQLGISHGYKQKSLPASDNTFSLCKRDVLISTACNSQTLYEHHFEVH